MRGEKLELNKIYNMDCIEGMKKLKEDGVTVDCIITDPPYNISADNNIHGLKGRQGFSFGDWDYGFNLTSWIDFADGVLKPGGNIVIFNDWKNLGLISDYLKDKGYLVKRMLTWKKTSPMPVNRDRLYVNTCEYAIWATKGEHWTFNRQKETYENGIFEFSTVNAKERIHPTQKPIDLLVELIKIHTNEGDLLLEPFSGSGSLAIAAHETGRDFIGFELDLKHYSKANERIEDVMSQKNIFDFI